MKAPSERQAAPEIIDAFADLFSVSSGAVRIITAQPTDGFDYLITAPDHTFTAEYKALATPGPLASAIESLKQAAETHPDWIPLLVVPFLSPRGRALCDQAAVSWLDLSGNCKITAPGLRLWVEGRPNRFVQRGRPSSRICAESRSRFAPTSR